MTEQRRALVVDDMAVNRLLAVKLLTKSGWTVCEADDGPAALTVLESAGTLELMLLDISMPQMSGQELCQIIRTRRLGGEGVKIIAYTAHAAPEDIAAFRVDGFDAVLAKPVSRGALGDVLTELGLGGS